MISPILPDTFAERKNDGNLRESLRLCGEDFLAQKARSSASVVQGML
jgi:predicted DNA-binding ribbon-helix-helix protein